MLGILVHHSEIEGLKPRVKKSWTNSLDASSHTSIAIFLLMSGGSSILCTFRWYASN